MDVDIAVAAGIEDPPTEVHPYDAQRLCRTVKAWLGDQARRLPRELVIALPSMSIEAWVIAGLFPRESSPEQVRDPARYLARKRRLELGENDRPIKPSQTYENFGVQVAAHLAKVRTRCPEADRFCRKVIRIKDEQQQV